jgi:O-antigen ligase
VFWIVVDLRTTWKTYKSYTKIAVLALFAVALYLVARYGIPIFQSSTTYFRLTDEYARRSDLGRIDLYSEAWKYFLQNPIFGLGFNQFRLYNSKGMYSHSTYMEILANTGMVGAVLFFAPHIWCLKWLTIIANNADTYNKKRTALLLLVYMISSLILAFGMNQLNNERVLMMYSLMFAYIICERERSIE